MKYKVKVVEVLERIVEVDADNETEAIRSVHNDYIAEDLVLDAEDFVGEATFTIEKEEE